MDDLIVIGAGWAGITAAALALDKGAKVRLIAQGIGSPLVTPGWISVWDSQRENWQEAVTRLVARVPDHPYTLAGVDSLVQAIRFFCAFTQKIGQEYTVSPQPVMTVLGKPQTPAAAPVQYAVEHGDRPLFIGFEGWRDYYPALSGQSCATIHLPMFDRPWDTTPTDLAREFDLPDFRKAVASYVKPHLNGATSVGFPAVLGLEYPLGACTDLANRIGVPVFEMPTLPPTVMGTRLFYKARRYFLDNGVRVQVGHPVAKGLVENGRVTGVEVQAAGKPQRFYAKAVLLATGGLYGGGLFSDDRGRVWEPIFGLPVQHDPDRSQWFNEKMLDPRGHPVHYFGVRANNRMQPLDANGEPVAEGLYVAGHILAHPHADDAPLPTECGEGVALATAYKAGLEALNLMSAQ